MPERVWADGFGNAIFLRQILDNQEDHLPCEACTTAVEEDCVGELGFYVGVQSGSVDVLEEDFQAAVANRHEAFFAPFAENAQETVFFVYITDL